MKNITTTGGVVRLVIYILGALIGLAALVLPMFGFTAAAGVLASLAALFAAITGGTASYNLPKAPDQGKPNVDVAAILPAFLALINEVKTYQPAQPVEAVPVAPPVDAPGTTLESLRDMLANRA